MSETKKDHGKRSFSPFLLTAVLLTLAALAEPVLADDPSLATYGAQRCAEVGITADDCTLLSAGPMPPVDPEPDAGAAKTAALIEHASWLCEQQGVPPEDCKALPTAYRVPKEEPSPSPFLTPAPTPPGPPIASAEQQPPPPARPKARPAQEPLPAGYRGQPVPVAQRDERYGHPPPPAGYGPHPTPAAAPDARYFREPPPIYASPAPLYGQAYPAPGHGPRVPLVEEEAFYVQAPPVAADVAQPFAAPPPNHVRRPWGDGFAAPTGRCWREVRSSGSPPHRFIACD